MSTERLVLIAGSANPELSADIAKYLGVPLAETLIGKFQDGSFSSLFSIPCPLSKILTLVSP